MYDHHLLVRIILPRLLLKNLFFLFTIIRINKYSICMLQAAGCYRPPLHIRSTIYVEMLQGKG